MIGGNSGDDYRVVGILHQRGVGGGVSDTGKFRVAMPYPPNIFSSDITVCLVATFYSEANVFDCLIHLEAADVRQSDFAQHSYQNSRLCKFGGVVVQVSTL